MKLYRIFMALVLLLTLMSCQRTEQDRQTETESTVSAAVQETEPHETETEITVVSILNITPADMALPDVEEPFWEDSRYLYTFGNPISEYVIVEYSDGSTRNLKDALADGSVFISDLDRFGIQYYTEEIEPLPPCGYGSGVEGFDSIRELIRQIESGTLSWTAQEIYDAYGCDTGALRELTGMDDGFREFLVEWCGGMNYSICYQKDDQVIAFMPCDTMEEMDQAASAMESWESLQANDLLMNLVKTDAETEDGIRYACTYDTKIVTGLRTTYHETTDASGIRRVVTNRYNADGTHSSGEIYVFDESAPFYCRVSGFEADMDFAKRLETKRILNASGYSEN